MRYKIFFSNIGYARGISGSLRDHVAFSGTHIYHSPRNQQSCLQQLKGLIKDEDPDICCFVEIDKGSVLTGFYNQIEALTDSTYHHFDIADKYGGQKLYNWFPLYWGKCNGFIAKDKLAFNHYYFNHGAKRLIYAVELANNVTLFFAHFSLRRNTRLLQLREIRKHALSVSGEAIIMADFNILNGLDELSPLLEDDAFHLLNDPKDVTFTFHKKRLLLDLCLCTPGLKNRMSLKIIPQIFSDHAALLATIDTP